MKTEAESGGRDVLHPQWERLTRANFWISKLSKWLWIIIRTVLIAGISFVVLYPIIERVSIAFKDRIDIYDNSVIMIPKHFTFGNFILVSRVLKYPEVLLNTVLLSGLVMLLQTFTCVLAGYGFSRMKFRGSGLLFACVIFTILVPSQTIMIPTYLQYKNFDFLGLVSLIQGKPLNLIDTFWPFVISSVLGIGLKTGLFVYIFRQFFRGIPNDLEEAAWVDGSGTFSTFIRIILPISIPAVVTVMLFSFVWQWNDSFFTGMILNDTKVMSSFVSGAWGQIIIYLRSTELTASEDPFYASMIQNTAVLMAISPLIIMYLFVQRHFVESMERSGMVG
jgi:multiple sugar transport system permease protein